MRLITSPNCATTLVDRLRFTLLCAAIWCLQFGIANAQLTGNLGAHDPSTIIFDDGRYYYFATGERLAIRSSANLIDWTGEPSAFDQVPASVINNVQEFQGEILWAPDVIKLDNQFHLYYSASTFGTKLSGIGLATSPTLDPDAPDYGWTDQGMIITSNHGSPYNAIDPSMLLDDDTGRLWMTWGSFNNGIYVKEMNPSNGLPLNSSPGVNVAAPGPTPEIEGAAMVKHDGDYYMFVNWGGCCSGVDSTYNVRVGRSSSPTGPFLDQDGVNLLNGGGTLFLDDDGRKFGPGHFSIFSDGAQDQFSYHYYDADRAGAPTFGLRDLHWTSGGWPSIAAVNPNWTGGFSGDWSQSANWTGGDLPDGVGHVANFVGGNSPRAQYSVALGATGHTVGTVNFRGQGRFTVGDATGTTLSLNDADGETATLNVAEGSHIIAAPITAADHLEANVTPSSSLLTLAGRLTAPGLTKYGAGDLTLAGDNSSISGTVFVRRGGVNVTGSVTVAGFSSVGQIVGESGTLTVSGTGRFTANADLNIGDSGDNSTPATGTLHLHDEASVVVNSGGGFYVGSGFFQNSRAEGAVIQSGGTLTVNRPADGSFVVGGRGSDQANGIYNLSGGTVAANTNVFIGGRGEGTVEQTGGVFNASQFLSIGRYSGSVGSWTIEGGTLNQSNAGVWLLVGEEGQGTLTLEGEGQVEASGAVQVGYRSSGAGVINLDGGRLTAPVISRGAGAATVNFNGGVLRAGANSAAFLQGNIVAHVNAGGGVIDTQSYSVGVTQALLHDPALGATPDGGLSKRGGGVLTLTAANTYTGGTTIDEGTLLASNATGSATGAGGVLVNAGGVFGGDGASAGTTTVNNGGVLAPGNSVGQLTVDALVLNAGSTFSIELAASGGVPGVDFDQLLVNGVASLGGDLRIDVNDQFSPGPNDSFTILTSGSLAGSFAGVLDGGFVNEIDGQGAFRVRYDIVPNAVVLTDFQSVPFLAGDFNGDGAVDAIDYAVWRENLGAPSGTLLNDPHAVAIGSVQYDTWRDNFGATLAIFATQSLAKAPAPSSTILLGYGVAMFLCRTRRRSGHVA